MMQAAAMHHFRARTPERLHTCPDCGAKQRGCNYAKHLRKYHAQTSGPINKQLIYDMYDAHLSMRAIVKQIGLSKEVVREVLWDRNERAAFKIAIQATTPARRVLRYLDVIEPLRPGTVYSTVRLSDMEIARTIYLYRDKEMSLKEVGAVLGIKGHTVWWRLHQAGVPLRSRSEANYISRKRGHARSHERSRSTPQRI